MRSLLLAALLLPTAAAARPTLALRIGYAAASGDAAEETPMEEVAKSAVPIQLDALYRFGPHFAAGLYFSYGFGGLNQEISDRCDALGADCSVSGVRLGAQGTYTFTQLSQRFAPWAGVGVGYEWVNGSVSRGGLSTTQRVTGWEIVNLQAGADFVVRPRFAVGPYVQLSIGRFTAVDGNDIADKAMHEWLNFGVRGRFDL